MSTLGELIEDSMVRAGVVLLLNLRGCGRRLDRELCTLSLLLAALRLLSFEVKGSW